VGLLRGHQNIRPQSSISMLQGWVSRAALFHLLLFELSCQKNFTEKRKTKTSVKLFSELLQQRRDRRNFVLTLLLLWSRLKLRYLFRAHFLPTHGKMCDRNRTASYLGHKYMTTHLPLDFDEQTRPTALYLYEM
jgi:hypothetical protein